MILHLLQGGQIQYRKIADYGDEDSNEALSPEQLSSLTLSPPLFPISSSTPLSMSSVQSPTSFTVRLARLINRLLYILVQQYDYLLINVSRVDVHSHVFAKIVKTSFAFVIVLFMVTFHFAQVFFLNFVELISFFFNFRVRTRTPLILEHPVRNRFSPRTTVIRIYPDNYQR